MIIKANKNNWSGEIGTFKVNQTEKSITFNEEKFFIRYIAKYCYEVPNMNYGTIAHVYKEDNQYFVENCNQSINRQNKCMYTAIYQLLNNII